MIQVLLYTFAVLFIVATVLDIHSTYKALQDSDMYEANILFRTLFKVTGFKLACLLNFVASVYVAYAFCFNMEPSYLLVVKVASLTTLRFAVAHSNYTKSPNWLVKVFVFLVPVYWNYGKIWDRIKNF